MKNKVAALLCLAFIFAWSNVHAQVSGNLPTTDLSKNKVMASPAISADDITWQRDVFRMLDLKDDHNAPLYFPPQPDGKYSVCNCALRAVWIIAKRIDNNRSPQNDAMSVPFETAVAFL